MTQERQSIQSERLLNAIIEGIHRKKGNDIVDLDFETIDNSVCRHFIICDADSDKQAGAIAESVEETVKKEVNEQAMHKEGFENAQWILIDYVDIVVHVFQKPYRRFYNLESLWADATLTPISE